jgi:MoaA/NifB/PqqE/SkfB family radical SAM enzyme
MLHRMLSKSINLVRRKAGLLLRKKSPLRDFALNADRWFAQQRYSLAEVFPRCISPQPYLMMLAITGFCNLRCLGCRYGRDFMVGQQLEWGLVRCALEDAKAAGIAKVRLYGGEPLLHPDLPRMVRYCRELDLNPSITTNANGLALKIDELFEAGLRDISVGLYGVGAAYDEYTQRKGSFRRMEEGLAAVRSRYGMQVDMQMNWLLRRQTCTPQALHQALDFARRYGATLQVDLVHYSLPYFTEGPDRMLQFRPEDRPAIELVVAELLRLRVQYPEIIRHTPEHMRSIPDWLLLGPRMRVPCSAYEMIWVGPDGTVQLCYVKFGLGNLHKKGLREILFSPAHVAAARDAFTLKCPNCHCSAGDRVMRHALSRRKYGTCQFESA